MYALVCAATQGAVVRHLPVLYNGDVALRARVAEQTRGIKVGADGARELQKACQHPDKEWEASSQRQCISSYSQHQCHQRGSGRLAQPCPR